MLSIMYRECLAVQLFFNLILNFKKTQGKTRHKLKINYIESKYISLIRITYKHA